MDPDAKCARNSREAAGWYDGSPEPSITHWLERLKTRQDPKWDSFSWLTVRALFESINDLFAKAGPSIVQHRRARWISGQLAGGVGHAQPFDGETLGPGSFGADFVIDRRTTQPVRCLLIGDTGEADASQYAVIDPLLKVHRAEAPGADIDKYSDFMVIVSDVIYPAGDINEYINGFYRPYREYDAPIYAIPGNHDWYDGLNGFMFHFCGAEPLPPVPYRRWSYRSGELWAELLWRGASRPDREELAPWMTERRNAERGHGPQGADPCLPQGGPAPGTDRTSPGARRAGAYPANRPVQPAPYHAIDTGSLMLVSIDTGVGGEIDAEQGQWLRRVSLSDKPKILLTGKPIYVNNEYHPGEIVWGDDSAESKRTVAGQPRPITVDDIVREPAHRYIAAIGGDIHNYQRYPVRLSGGRTIEYIVSGGGGAYLTATHMIPTVGPTNKQDLPADVKGFDEKSFRCYPLRGDSLALFARRIGPVAFNLILSAWALIPAAVFVLLWILDPQLSGDETIAITASSFVSAVVIGLVVATFVARDAVIDSTRSGYRMILVASAVAVFGAGLAALMTATESSQVDAAIAITLGMPFLIMALLVAAYDARGSGRPAALSFLVIAPAVALWTLFQPFDLTGAAFVLAYVLAPILLVSPAVWVVERARENLGEESFWLVLRVVVTALWAALTVKVLADHEQGSLFSAEAWLAQVVAALLLTTFFVARVIPNLSGGARRKHQTHQLHGLGEATTAIVAISVIALLLLGLEAIGGSGGDGFPADVTAAAFSALTGAFAVLVVLGSFFWLRLNPRTFFGLRTGIIDPDQAAMFVSQKLGGGAPVRPPGEGVVPGKRAGMADAVRRLGKAVAEVADTNEPPFYKSFLSVEVQNEEAVIRCHGVTGYCEEPTVEDCVRISLREPREAAAGVESSA